VRIPITTLRVHTHACTTVFNQAYMLVTHLMALKVFAQKVSYSSMLVSRTCRACMHTHTHLERNETASSTRVRIVTPTVPPQAPELHRVAAHYCQIEVLPRQQM
jgi:hypothetical protein